MSYPLLVFNGMLFRFLNITQHLLQMDVVLCVYIVRLICSDMTIYVLVYLFKVHLYV